MKKVSVVIACYNTGELLYTCLDSLVNQTVGIDDLDVVIVDDGSTDNISVEIIEKYVAKYPNSFRLLRKPNGGQGSARNMAFPYCVGEYVTCLDSDDSFDVTWVEKMYGKAISENADFVGCGYKAVKYVDGKEVVVRDMDMRKICSNNREMFIDADVCMFTTLFKKTVLDASTARYPEGYIYEDTAFFIELLPWINKPVYINEALSCRTLHEGSTMTNVKPEKVANIFPVFDYLVKFFEDKNLKEEYSEELDYFIGKVLLCSNINRIGFIKKFSDRRKMIRRTQEEIVKHVPEFRSNSYISGGAKNFYLKHYNRFLMNLMAEALHIRFLIKRDYNT